MMKKVLQVISSIFYAFFVFLFLLNCYLLSSKYLFHQDYPSFFGYTYFEVQTGSMRSDIKEQDIIIVKLDDSYEVGDIITYKSNNSLITHRITKVEKDTVITKGDANNMADNPVDKKMVVGKVVKVLPKFGIYLKVITDKGVMILFFLLAVSVSYYLSLLEKKEVLDEKKEL